MDVLRMPMSEYYFVVLGKTDKSYRDDTSSSTLDVSKFLPVKYVLNRGMTRTQIKH
jgi:hypothetical protein